MATWRMLIKLIDNFFHLVYLLKCQLESVRLAADALSEMPERAINEIKTLHLLRFVLLCQHKSNEQKCSIDQERWRESIL